MRISRRIARAGALHLRWFPAVIALAACATTLPAVPSTTHARVSAVATPLASPAHGAVASHPPAAKANPLAGAKGNLVLHGVVSLDASYVLRVKRGQLLTSSHGSVLVAGSTRLVSGGVIGNDGSTVISNDGSTVISNDGSTVISNDGSTVISNDGSTVISNDGSTLISNDGSSVVAAASGNMVAPASLISNDGSSLIAVDGGNAAAGSQLISNDGSSYGLLAAATPLAGQFTPAAGMALWVRSLDTGKPVPLGTDAGGKPAYAVYTNLQGAYQVYLPARLEGNVEVVAMVPQSTDVRLAVRSLTPVHDTDSITVDEDTATVDATVLDSFARAGLPVLSGDLKTALASLHVDEEDAAGQALVAAALQPLLDAAKAGHFDRLDPVKDHDRLYKVSYELAGKAAAAADLGHAAPRATTLPADSTLYQPTQSSTSILADILRDRRAAAQELFDSLGDAKAEALFDGLDVVKELRPAGFTGHMVQRASDVPALYALIMNTFIFDGPTIRDRIHRLEAGAGLRTVPSQTDWMMSATGGLADALEKAEFADPQVTSEMEDRLRRGP